MSEIIVIHNQQYMASFSTLGAETLTLVDIVTGHNYLWSGDARWWGGHSPILFPATGGLWNATAHIGGDTFAIPKHGFAKRREWRVEEKEENRVTFLLTPEAGDEAFYPYSYEVRVTYALEADGLTAQFRVLNTGAETLLFQMGGHPGLQIPGYSEDVPVNGYLRIGGDSGYVLRAGEQGCIICEADGSPKHFPFAPADGDAPLCVETFANEALIYDVPVGGATLLDLDKRPLVRVESDAPAWLFWQPQGVHSPFVCCEPWYGLPDHIGFSGDITERPFIQQAAPGATWEGGYRVIIL